jgi:hypothetical protein
VNPNMFPNEVNGITMPAMTTAIVVAAKARLGRLRKEIAGCADDEDDSRRVGSLIKGDR